MLQFACYGAGRWAVIHSLSSIPSLPEWTGPKVPRAEEAQAEVGVYGAAPAQGDSWAQLYLVARRSCH